jgi:prophage tail gpP-like protein
VSLFTPESEQAWIKVQNRIFAGWTGVDIGASVESLARTFSFKAASRWPNELHLLRIRPGSRVEVNVGSDRVVTGWVDKLDAGFDRGSHTLTVTGRSLTGDLVDCAATGETSFRRKDAVRICRTLAAGYEVEIRNDLDNVGEKLRRFDLQDGELVGAALQRLALLRGFLVTDNELGELVLTRAGYEKADVALVVGGDRGNVLSGSASVDVSGRFSEYRVKSLRVGDDNDFGDVLQSLETAEDTLDDLGRRRVYELTAEAGEDKARTRERAEWEAATRYGQSISVSYAVQGWRQREGGALWRPNMLVDVFDDLAGIRGELLVVDVAFGLNDSGTTTKLTLAPIEGYELLPPAKPRRRRRRPTRAVSSPYSALADGVDLGANASGTGQSSATAEDLD